MRSDLPKGYRSWEIVRRAYILAAGAYALAALAFAGMSVRTLGSPSYAQPPWLAGSFALTEAFAFAAGMLVSLYFLIVAWFGKRHHEAAYLHETMGDDVLRGGGDAFNWALYSVILVYGALYVVISLCFGELG